MPNHSTYTLLATVSMDTAATNKVSANRKVAVLLDVVSRYRVMWSGVTSDKGTVQVLNGGRLIRATLLPG